jgi:lipopolysaccharide export system protein LptC
MALRSNHNKSLRLVLLMSMLLIFGVVLTVFIGYRTVSNPKEMVLSSMIKEDVAISMDDVQQTSTKNGVKDWSLKAASAQFLHKKKQVVFDNLAVTFYLDDGGTVNLSAQKGYLNTETQDILIDGNVVADDGDIKFRTESLDYDHEQRILLAAHPVQIFGDRFSLTAESVAYDMAARRAIFEGKVEGTLFDSFN